MKMYETIPNDELCMMIRELWEKWGMTKNVFSIAPHRTPASMEEHTKILKMIEKKEYDDVEQFVRRHKLAAGTIYREALQEQEYNLKKTIKN